MMTRSVVVVQADSLLEDAVHLMQAHKVSGLPVLDSHGEVVGILTEGDLLRRTETDTEARPSWMQVFFETGKIAESFARAHARRVSEVMSADVVSVVETTPLRDVVALLEGRRIKRVPVMRQKVVVGIVARADIVRALGNILDSGSPVSQSATDDMSIRRKLQSSLDEAAWTPRGITFTVTDGRVHLYGSLKDDRDRSALKVTAENVPGVVSVTDHVIDTNQDAYKYLRPDGDRLGF